MIVVRASGGLGNQMFQYAFALSLHHHTDRTVLINRHWFNRQKDRVYAMASITGDDRPKGGVKEAVIPVPSRLIKAGQNKRWAGFLHFETHPYAFEPAVFRPGRFKCLIGYWQNPRYFESVESRIRDLYVRKEESHSVRSLYSELDFDRSVAIHIRRGDYLDPRNRVIHGLLTKEYFLTALEEVRKQFGVKHINVFTDSPELVQEESWLPPGTRIVSLNRFSAAEELRLLSKHRFKILSNSTLSWWAAWLGEYPDQFVVYPNPWNRSEEIRPGADFFGDSWIPLPASYSE